MKPLKSIEKRLRRMRDRMMYASDFPDVNHLLHELRGQAFSRLDFMAEHLVSVGCAGTWYFDWIEERFGAVSKHTGVEFYSPKPDDLPANCEWIANTAGSMPEIQDTCADAVFSGQNLEHLWPEEVTGFFLESNRILKTGGKLVVDSPNRNITTQLNWSHPEHTVELTPTEAVELCELSGFDVEKVEGIWQCEDLESGEILPFEKMLRFGSKSMKSRMANGTQNPEQSFIWWVVATKSDRAPQKEALERRMSEIFALAWPERCDRTLTSCGVKTAQSTFVSNGKPGVVMFGPYMPVRGGDYVSTTKVKILGLPKDVTTADKIDFSVRAGTECDVLGEQSVALADKQAGENIEVEIPFSVPDTTFGIQFRVDSNCHANIECDCHVELRGWQEWEMARAA